MRLKYEITDIEKTIFNGSMKVCRIRALEEINTNNPGNKVVLKGDLGGWVSSYENLSHEGTSWIFDDAVVCGDARVKNNAIVRDNAMVYHNAIVRDDAIVKGEACVKRNAVVGGRAYVLDNAKITDRAAILQEASVGGQALAGGYSTVTGNADVDGEACICHNAFVDENASVSDGRIYGILSGTVYFEHSIDLPEDACLRSVEDYFVVHGIGGERSVALFYRDRRFKLKVARGCFLGTLEEFAEAVEKTHGNSRYGDEYRKLIEFAKIRFQKQEKKSWEGPIVIVDDPLPVTIGRPLPFSFNEE